MASKYKSLPVAILTLASALFIPLTLAAQEHVIPLNELRQKAQAMHEERVKNETDLERVLSYPAAADALNKANVNQKQMHQAVATLSDDELARLADRARANEKDVQGGLIVGILALIGLVVVIIIVVALVH